MVTQEESFCNQKAVVWKQTGTDNYGNPTVTSPTQILIRFDKQQGETLDTNSQVLKTVATIVLKEDIANGGIIWLGHIDDLPASPTPLYEVIDFSKIVDVKGRHPRRVAKAIRFNGVLPTQV